MRSAPGELHDGNRRDRMDGMSPAKKSAKGMTDAHKAALAEGRAQGRAVRAYLEAL